MSKYIRFDWAMKRLLRNKANYGVLEGFLTTLLEQPIRITKMLESESNRDDENDKSNIVDILAENDKGQLFIIEVQNNTETAYYQRILFGTSKLVTEYIERGCPYDKVRKIYSINIVYFALGGGNDVVYHGKTEFRGLHNPEDVLSLSPFQQQKFQVSAVSDLFPEYYILRVNDFDKVAKTPLEEWIYYLNHGDLPQGFSAPGLDLVQKQLEIDRMSKTDRNAYYSHLDKLVRLQDSITTATEEAKLEARAEGLEAGRAEGLEAGRAEGLEAGRAEGRAEGLEAGRAEGRAEGEHEKALAIARAMKQSGKFSVTDIAFLTGLPENEIAPL